MIPKLIAFHALMAIAAFVFIANTDLSARSPSSFHEQSASFQFLKY